MAFLVCDLGQTLTDHIPKDIQTDDTGRQLGKKYEQTDSKKKDGNIKTCNTSTYHIGIGIGYQ